MSNFNVSNFMINNIGLLVTLILAVIGLIQAVISRNKQKVFANIFELVSDAQQLAGTTGLEKFNFVFDNAYNKLPRLLRLFISKDDIKRAIEYSLNKLKAFASMQSINTSMQATSYNVVTNTNIQTPADQAAQTIHDAQPMGDTPADDQNQNILSNPVDTNTQDTIRNLHDDTPEENVPPEVKAAQ